MDIKRNKDQNLKENVAKDLLNTKESPTEKNSRKRLIIPIEFVENNPKILLSANFYNC